MARPKRQNRLLTYEDIYKKIIDAKVLTLNEIVVLSAMKKNARLVNKKTIVKERKIMPTKTEIKNAVQSVEENGEYNETIINYIQQVCELQRYKPKDSKDIIKVGEKYFELCAINHLKPTSSSLAMALGMSRKELLSIVNGEVRVLYGDAYQFLWQMLEMYDETAMKDQKINPVVAIFNQKNNHGWTDKVEIVHNNDKTETDEEIKKRYEQMEDIIEVESVDASTSNKNTPTKSRKKKAK